MPTLLNVNRHLLMHGGIQPKVDLVSPEIESFGDWMKTARLQADFATQSDLAKAMNWDQSMVSRVESGKREPTAEFVLALAKALGIDQRLVAAKAGLSDAPIPVSEQTRAELLSVFDQLSDDDQSTLIELARALRRQEQKRGRGKTAPA